MTTSKGAVHIDALTSTRSRGVIFFVVLVSLGLIFLLDQSTGSPLSSICTTSRL